MEGFGEFLFGGLQLLLGFLELTDIAHHHYQRGGGVEIEWFGRDQAGEYLPVAASKGHFQVANAASLQALQKAGTDAR